MQLEMENIEQECDNLHTETTKTKERISESSLRLHQLTSITSPEQQMIDQVTIDHTAMNSEIESLQQEKLSIQDASKNLSDEIEECKRRAAHLSSEISEIDMNALRYSLISTIYTRQSPRSKEAYRNSNPQPINWI